MTAPLRQFLAAGALALTFGPVGAGPQSDAGGPSLIGIDHMPTVVADLDAATASYRSLGFVLKPGRFHVDGLRNSHIKFEDGSGVELIAPPDRPNDALTRSYARFLRAGEGPAAIAFHARDIAALTRTLERAHIPFAGEGGLVTLADPDLDFLFFVRDNRSPTDRPEHFAHPNTAVAMTELRLALDRNRSDKLRRLLLALGAVPSDDTAFGPTAVGAAVYVVENGRVVVAPDAHRSHKDRPIVGVTFRVGNAHAAGRFVGATPASAAPLATHGLRLRFEP